MRRRISAVVIALLIGLGLAKPSSAAFHLTVIDEVMTSYGGDPSVQFVEMRTLNSFQNFVAHAVFAAFDDTGTYVGDILVVPMNVKDNGTGTRWLIGTAAFQTATGVAPDFVMPAGILPMGGGMVCYGGGPNAVVPQNPPTWSRTTFTSYVDCVAYGTFAGASNVKIGTPTSLNGDGHSLQRTGNTMNNAADFTCADPATPQNNAGATKSMAATSPCAGSAATPTSTPPAPTTTPVPPSPTATSTPPATMTATSGPVGTPTATVPAHPCIGDCDGNGHVAINELIVAVNIALGTAEPSTCPAFGGADKVAIADLITAVNNALNGCPTAPS